MSPIHELTDAELAVMEALWDSASGVTVRDIALRVYGRHDHSLHGGMKSFLDRLLEKGFVSVDESQFAHRLPAELAREQKMPDDS